jgi:hypothetical protein
MVLAGTRDTPKERLPVRAPGGPGPLGALLLAGAFLLLFVPPGRALPYGAGVNVDPAGAGLDLGDVSLGDFDGDGDLDVLASGRNGGGINRQLWLYTNNGAGVFTGPTNVGGANRTGFSDGGVAWADFNNDGRLDAAANGSDLNGFVWPLRAVIANL